MLDLVWTQTALRDLDDIGSFIALDSPRAAEAIVRRIVEAVSALAWHPKLGPTNDDNQTRRLIVTGTPYVVIYRIAERVEILTVFHASRAWPDRFV